jgi:hypothetical protein
MRKKTCACICARAHALAQEWHSTVSVSAVRRRETPSDTEHTPALLAAPPRARFER